MTFLYLDGPEPTHWFTFWDHVIVFVLGLGFISATKKQTIATTIQCSILFLELCLIANLIVGDHKVFALSEKGRFFFQTQNYVILFCCFGVFMPQKLSEKGKE